MANPFAQFAPTDSTTETKSTEPNQFAKFASIFVLEVGSNSGSEVDGVSNRRVA